ncbi:MAG: hypothetical protein DMG10_29045 [Acidobacteria bacterium]|nr:MAG: hypothetical protein DMG10_29045 [Acidobacteriota bacterium]
MGSFKTPVFFLRKGASSFHHVLWVLAIALALGIGPATQAWQEARIEQVQTEDISAAGFSRIVREFSEEDGFFRSDNFVSNETSYLHILDKLRVMGGSGGAYIGVGPEQNFTYIAKMRPRIAFIVDIRRQAMIQHLMLKAIFQLSENRAEFLSRLVSRPLTGEDVPGRGAPIDKILAYLSASPASEEYFTANLASIRKLIQNDLQFPGTGNWGGPQWAGFPSLKELVLESDLHGRPGNFLVTDEDYAFVRDLQRRNRIIPVVGNFSGTKALAAVADYLKKNGYTVSAFYTSNVEQYLFANGTFAAFVENVRKLPITEKSLFIRAFPNMREPHPARIPGHRLTTLLQKVSDFLQDYDKSLYPDYWSLVTTHYIAAEEP